MGRVYVSGSGFGTATGAVRLIFSSGQSVQLTNLIWDYNLVNGIIPADIYGVPDQSAAVQLVTWENAESNKWPVAFTAARRVEFLPASAVQGVSCSASDNRNWCRIGPHGFDGFHTGWIFGSSGSDTYTVTLKNGWVLHSATKLSVGGFNGNASGPEGFAPGSASAKLVMDWSYGVVGNVGYGTEIYVIGPAGVPFQ